MLTSSAASSRAESQQAFRLLDLPLEIRLMIFRYVAPSGCVMLTMQPFEWPMLVREWDMFDDDHEVVNVKLSVLRVCRQWFRESVQMIISENKLWFGPGEWRGQLQSLPAEFPSWCNTIRMSFDRTEADRQPDQGLNLEYAVDRRIQLEGIGSQFDGTPFGQMCERRRKEVCHDLHEEQIIDLWLHKVNLLAQLEPKHLEFDVTHAWCPARCCRLAKRVFNMFKHAKQGRPDCNSGIVPQVTLVGTYETEEPIIWSLINEAYGFHRDDTRLRRQVPVNNLTGEQREVLEDFEAEIEEQGSDA